MGNDENTGAASSSHLPVASHWATTAFASAQVTFFVFLRLNFRPKVPAA